MLKKPNTEQSLRLVVVVRDGELNDFSSLFDAYIHEPANVILPKMKATAANPFDETNHLYLSLAFGMDYYAQIHTIRSNIEALIAAKLIADKAKIPLEKGQPVHLAAWSDHYKRLVISPEFYDKIHESTPGGIMYLGGVLIHEGSHAVCVGQKIHLTRILGQWNLIPRTWLMKDVSAVTELKPGRLIENRCRDRFQEDPQRGRRQGVGT